MALPYTITLEEISRSGGDFGIAQWEGTVPAARHSGSGSAAISVTVIGQGAGANVNVDIDISDQAGVEVRRDFTDELESARLVFQNGAGDDLFDLILADVDASDPYALMLSRADGDLLFGAAGGLRLHFIDPVQAIDADPGTVQVAAPTATASSEVQGPLYADGEIGTVSTAAPSAQAQAAGDEDPVDADPGTVQAAAPAARLRAGRRSGSFADVLIAGALPAPSATARAGRLTATVNANPGTVSTAAPTAVLTADISGQEVDAEPGAVSAAAPTAVLRAERAGEVDVIIRVGAPGPRAAFHPDVIGGLVDADIGTLRVGAPSATLSLSIEDLGEAYNLAIRATSPEHQVVTCVELDHDEAPTPVRLVNDGEDLRVGGATYTATRFEARLADDVERRAARAELSIGNVGR